MLVLALHAAAIAPAFVRAHEGVHLLHARLHLRVALFPLRGVFLATLGSVARHRAVFGRAGLARAVLMARACKQGSGAECGGGEGCGDNQLLHHFLLEIA